MAKCAVVVRQAAFIQQASNADFAQYFARGKMPGRQRYGAKSLSILTFEAKNSTMRITDVEFPDQVTAPLGLHPVVMGRLGQVVMISGKNGSGKSRLLNLVEAQLRERPNSVGIRELRRMMDSYLPLLADKTRGDRANLIETYEEWERIARITEFIKVNDDAAVPQCVRFVPRNLSLSDPAQTSQSNLLNMARDINSPGIEKLSKGVLARIQLQQNRWWSAGHPKSTIGADEKRDAEEQYARLNRLISTFLGVELGRNVDDIATLFDRPLGQIGLSDGQSILLQLCLAIYAQADSLSNLIIIMDEPENHLHPEALLWVYRAILEKIPDGQLWVATHSISLLSNTDSSALFFMENGKIARAGKEPEKVLLSLLGDDEQRMRHSEFLNLPEAYGSNQFAIECMLPPTVADASITDPQTTQIRSILEKYCPEGLLNVLDFGAGKGRLIETIAEYQGSDKEIVKSWLNYFAFDLYTENQGQCVNAIGSVYDNATERYFSNEDKLEAAVGRRAFDVIVMCNVMHEIHPKYWLSLFTEGLVAKLLKENGVLLLVEDQLIPTGELAHEHGFLVLPTLQLKQLFSISPQDDGFVSYDKYGDGRLMVHEIAKKHLVKITKESRDFALRTIQETARTQITSLRSAKPSFKSGKLHGFWTQQLANAQLIAGEL